MVIRPLSPVEMHSAYRKKPFDAESKFIIFASQKIYAKLTFFNGEKNGT
ncbi:MAG: hypothetical protein ACJAZI_000112 [Cycloclasticus sp.]|jgi:hypothetical protein